MGIHPLEQWSGQSVTDDSTTFPADLEKVFRLGEKGGGPLPSLGCICSCLYVYVFRWIWCSSKQDVYVCFLRFVKKMGSARWLISWCLTFSAFLSQVKDFCAAQKGEGTVAQPAS